VTAATPEEQSMPTAPHSNNTTSKEAARLIGSKAASDRCRLLDYLKARGRDGATDKEIGEALGLGGDTVRPRRWELVNAGLVVDSEETRRTPSGRNATVWVVLNTESE
jgi:predicted ArsR family transcriptional regulator